ncbi:N-6 DNA methylase [Thiolapillus sp.]
MNVQAQYELIRKMAPEFALGVKSAARSAHNEAEFRTAVYDLIKEAADRFGASLLLREEYTLATGRADAVYNRFIIEYEPPGSLRANLSHKHTAHAVNQVKDYIDGLAKAEKHDRDRLLGVAFDGYYYIFVRYHAGHWIVEDPLEVTEASSERFLRSLFSLSSGRALIPENLVEDFGSRNLLSHQATLALYNALSDHEEDLTARLFEQWKIFFGEAAGADAAAGELKHKKELLAFARGMGLRSHHVDMPRFLFALHTYFSFLVKNIARLVLLAHAGGSFGATPLTKTANLKGDALRRELEKLESGDLFRTLGFKNLLEGDFFAWYLDAWNSDIENALQPVLARLAEYNPATIQDDPYSARDLLKKLYHYLLPRDIRHDLGEFYTPDWLAERLLNQLGEPWFTLPKGTQPPKDLPGKRLLDPACGSGTFLVLAIRALKANAVRAGLAESEMLNTILNSIVGIDLNPLAVMAARVNYLLAVADLLPYRDGEIEIPVYLADSILAPARGKDIFTEHSRIFETAVGPLPVPVVIDTRAEMERLTDLLEEYVSGDFSTEAFLERCKREIPDITKDDQSEAVLKELYETLQDLHRRGLDGIWARVLKNAFMPLFLEPFEYVAGNPPWINWENLPQGYRERTAELWARYGLFVHSGMDTILGKGRKDVSTLMTYAIADRLMKDGGKLGFLITQSVWKTGAGQGFRRFRIGASGPFLRVLHVDDLSSLQIFEGASTRTSIFLLQKGQPTRYPVPYTYWKKTTRGKRLDYESTLDEVLSQTKRLQFYAIPVEISDLTSSWLTARRKALDAVRKVVGASEYRAYEGANSGGANAVYWLEALTERPDGLLMVRNVTEGAKRKVESITTELESDLVYPLLRGRDVQRWHASSSRHILMVQDSKTRRGIDENLLQQRYPKTWAYLKRFEQPLRERASFKRYFTRKDKHGHIVETAPFYSMFNVGNYTFAPWKVVWREQAAWFTVAVVGPGNKKVIIPDHKLMLVPCKNAEEAYYLGGLLNSAPATLTVWFYAISIQQNTHILNNIAIPKYHSSDTLHQAIATLSHRAHELAPLAYSRDKAAQAELEQVETEIDHAAAQLWGLTEEDLQEIRASLKELRG